MPRTLTPAGEYALYSRSEDALAHRPVPKPFHRPVASTFRRVLAQLTATVYWGDFSHYVGVDNWDTYAKGSPLMGWKASQGTGFTDPTFLAAKNAARKRGLVVVAYHFLDPGNTGAAQAAHFLKVAPPEKGVIPCLDFEGGGQSVAQALAFVKAIEAAYGRKPWVYGHVDWMGVAASADPNKVLASCGYWGPTYGSSLTVPPIWAHGRGTLVAWQRSDGKIGPTPHSLAGVGHTSDVSRLEVPMSMVLDQAGLGAPTPPPGGDDDMVPQDIIDKWSAYFDGMLAGFRGDPRPPGDDPKVTTDFPIAWSGWAAGKAGRAASDAAPTK